MNQENHPHSDEPTLRPHLYDGIQEYDQKLPNWWLFTFYIAIAWFIFHWLAYYQFKIISTDEQEISAAMEKIEVARNKDFDAMTNEKFWAMSHDPAVISAGEATYKSICIACHGADMMGKKTNPILPGLALADQEWKYGHNPIEILRVVRKGSPDLTKGMPAWEQQLGSKRVIEAVAFIFSKHKEGEPFLFASDQIATSAAEAPTPVSPTIGSN